METLSPDICVIGGGSGGLTVAAAAATFGVPVVLVEKARLGGDCLYAGCVPSKSLIAAGRHARAMAEAKLFGVSALGLEVDFAGVHAHIAEVIAAIAPNDSKERYRGLGVRVIDGAARFRDARTVTVGGEIEIRARRFVIATGSSPALPPIPGLDAVAYLTNETVFDLTHKPEHLIVIGAGPQGLELAQALRRLGSAVTVLDAGPPLAHEDGECAQIVVDELKHEGIALRANVAVIRVEKMNAQVSVVIRDANGEQAIGGTHLLVAAGRRANVDGLGLEQAGIACDSAGIVVGKNLRTTNKRVYAIGDVAGGAQLTHLANYHAGLVIRNALFRLPVRANADVVPRVTFTDPELAHVGLSESEAARRRLKVRVLRWPYHENDRARAERDARGHIKVITSRTGRVLGATIVGAAAGELITTWTLAVARGMRIGALAGMVVPYPTLSEVGKRAAMTYFTPSLTSPLVRRMIAWLRRLG